MSPECGWFELSSEIKEEAKVNLGCNKCKKRLHRLLNSENGFFITENFSIIEADKLSKEELEKKQRRARKDPNYYHVISLKSTQSAINTRKTWNEKLGYITLENAETTTGHPNKYRGNHRSHTRGPQTLFYNKDKKISH